MPIGISSLLPDYVTNPPPEAVQAVAEVIDYTEHFQLLLLALGILIGVTLGGILFRRWL